LIGAWVAYLGIAIWQHALASAQTPWGDGLSYLQKALSFWHAVERGHVFNPLNLDPTIRPPGTVLMSYPFGLTPDFRGYHFRSIFLPLFFVVIAVYVAAGARALRQVGWRVAAIAVLFSSLPLFYWLDWNEERWLNNGWGMVDNFQAGVAALAAASLVRTLASRSLAWILLASLLASLTFLVKQSGLMLMGSLGLVWLIVLAIAWRAALAADRAALWRYALKGALIFGMVYAAVVASCLLSGYLSGSNFAYAMKALGFYGAVADPPSLRLFHSASGEAAVLWLVAIAALLIHRRLHVAASGKGPSAVMQGLVLGSVVLWVLGLWYWIVVQAGGTQIRYFYPFMLAGAIFAVPAALDVWSSAGRVTRAFLALVCVVPAVNIGALLAAGDSPSAGWQAQTGVSVSVGQDRDVVKEAYAFLDAVRKTKKDVRVYFFPNGAIPHTFMFVGAYEKLINPQLPSFSPVNPMDWSRGFAVRVDELLDSDYVLARKTLNGVATGRFEAASYPTFHDETNAFDGWFATLDRPSGVEVVVDGPLLRLLRIVDRQVLGQAVAVFVAAHTWRPEFYAANKPAPRAWWQEDELRAEGRQVAADEVRFDDAYLIHSLAIDTADNAVKVDVWWEELRHEDANDKRYLFLHLVDAKGAIVHNLQIALYPYQPPDAARRWRYSTATFVAVLPNAALKALAFGVYQPDRADGGFLLGDRGKTDWDGKRVVVPLPDPASGKGATTRSATP